MCIAIPMQIVERREGRAICETTGRVEDVDMALVGDLPIGAWVLVFLGAAREQVSEERARQITDALGALTIALDGGDRQQIDVLFPDLVDREPELPEFLRQQAQTAEP